MLQRETSHLGVAEPNLPPKPTPGSEPASPTRRLQLLGAFRLTENSGTTIPLRHGEQRPVALLAVRGAHCRSSAAAYLWPATEEPRARANLRSVLSRVRALTDLVHQDGDVLYLSAVSVDYMEVKTWSEQILRADPTTALGDPPQPVDQALLPTWDEQWLESPREELRMLELDALEVAATRLVAFGRLALASSLVRTATRLDPLRESASRVLIEIHMREGNTSAAITEYRRIQQVVMDETGTRPNPSLTALMASLSPPTRVWPTDPQPTTMRPARNRRDVRI